MKNRQSKILLFLIIEIVVNFSFLNANNKLKEIEHKLLDSKPEVRAYALVNFLDLINRDLALDSVQLIIPLLEDTDINVQLICIKSIGELFLKPQGDNKIEVIETFNPRRINIDFRYIAAAQKVIPHLINKLKDRRYKIRAFSATSLGQIGSPAAIAVSYLIKVLKNDEIYVVRQAVVALGNIGKESKDAVPIIKECLKSNDDKLVYFAEQALKLIEQ